MRTFYKIASSLFVLTILTHNAITGTVSKIEKNTFKDHNDAAYRIHLTDGTPTQNFAAGKDANFRIITTSYLHAFLCASGRDTSKCKVRPANEL